MNTARIIVLTIALGAGGIAAAKSDIGLGRAVGPGDQQWQTWPEATPGNSFFRGNERPDSTIQIGNVVRYGVPNSTTTLKLSKGRPK
jgi:pilus assembly protein CpaB